jgi:hypothetical protein
MVYPDRVDASPKAGDIGVRPIGERIDMARTERSGDFSGHRHGRRLQRVRDCTPHRDACLPF